MATGTASVRSADGTVIGYDTQGDGPALIMVDAAGCYRGFGPQHQLAKELAADFTVFSYDRRGRGQSTDTLPYAVDREVDDLAALIAEAGGSAFVYGFSSGGLLALHAAACGLPIKAMALLEPPIGNDDYPSADAEFTAALDGLVTAGKREEAVEFFQRNTGVPAEYVAQGESLAALAAIAHTLVYDCTIVTAATFELVRSVPTRTLVLDSEGTSDNLASWAAAVGEALPQGTRRSLPGGWHGIPAADLAAALTTFFYC